jgi:tRNA(Ile)-lysidine synthase
MRISRGSTLNGYAGFNFITDKPNYKIVRPLIYLTKDEIEEYNNNNDIPYNIDNTNFEDEHTRNRFRHKVLPFLKNENKNIHKQFIKYHNTVQSYYDYVNKLVYMNKDNMFKDNILELNKFNGIDEFLKDKLLCEIIRDYYPDDLYYVGSTHVNEIIKMINSDKPTITITLPRGIKIHKEYDKLIFNYEESETNDYFYEIKKEISTPSGNIYIVEESNDTSNFTIRLKNDKYYVRNIKQGDVMNVKNMKSNKKIKDILINEKVPLNDRKKLPVVVNSNDEIVWIPGIKKSNFDIPINGDYDIILKYVKEKKNEE